MNRITVRLDVTANSALELMKRKKSKMTASRIVRELIMNGVVSPTPSIGPTPYNITFRLDDEVDKKIAELCLTFNIDTSELVRRLLAVQVRGMADQMELGPVMDLTDAMSARSAYNYVVSLRAAATKYASLAGIADKSGTYRHEAVLRAELLSRHADMWFDAIGRYLNDRASNTDRTL